MDFPFFLSYRDCIPSIFTVIIRFRRRVSFFVLLSHSSTRSYCFVLSGLFFLYIDTPFTVCFFWLGVKITPSHRLEDCALSFTTPDNDCLVSLIMWLTNIRGDLKLSRSNWKDRKLSRPSSGLLSTSQLSVKMKEPNEQHYWNEK